MTIDNRDLSSAIGLAARPLRARASSAPAPMAKPSWRRRIETLAVVSSFAILALVLFGIWLALMEANRWT